MTTIIRCSTKKTEISEMLHWNAIAVELQSEILCCVGTLCWLALLIVAVIVDSYDYACLIADSLGL